MTKLIPYAVIIRGNQQTIFELSDEFGFDGPMTAQAISIFEDGFDSFHLQALYETEIEAQTALNAIEIPRTCEAFITQLPDEDWVSKSQQGLPPVFANRFCVYGAHSLTDIPHNFEHPIQIEAGPAFGTGHHGTTKGCLLLFDELLTDGFKPATTLDLGCGAGTLAIAAAMALKTNVLATDIDQDAVDVALSNAAINSVHEFVTAHRVDGFEDPLFHNQNYDLIFANILAGPLMGLAPDISHHLAPSGKVILSGILDEQADQVKAAFEAENLDIKKGPSLEGWTSLLGTKL